MPKQWKKSEFSKIRNNIHENFGTRIIEKKHKGKRIDKAINTSNFLYRNRIHIGEFCVALLLSFSTTIFGNGNTTPNNQELVYPLQEVSTLECRTGDWDILKENCKIELPIINGANFKNYIGNKTYTDIYTVLYGGNYNSGWDTNAGSHYGVDIATAKGTPLYAIADSKVYFAGEQTGYGNVIKIEFIYNGIKYYAIYGHMNSLNVKTGDTVSKGQKIGTVGNSGVTMGALGGYHVHFEIAKGDSNRPIYAFYGCKDLDKGGITIINQGLCRTEMFNRTIDPIALLEGSNAKLPHPNNSTKTNKDEHNVAENKIASEDRNQILKIAKLFLDSPYQLGGTGNLPGMATDCSNFTKTVFANVGITLERSSADQAYQFAAGGYWYDNLDMAEIGDLIFFKNTYNSEQEITHVGIYAGDGMMIHAGSQKVEIIPLDTYWKEHFKGIGSFKYLYKNYNKETAQTNYLKISRIPSSQINQSIQTNKIDTIKIAEEKSGNNIQNKTNSITKEKSIKLEDTKLDATGKQFFKEWSIKIEGDTTTNLKKGETRTLKLNISKENGDKYNGILKQPIMFISNSTNITINPTVISLVKNGEVTIELKSGQQSGDVYIAINLGTNKMGGFNLKIQ